ncbi:D-alanyl carrier protein, partial [Bienertia sinuspersici]
VGFDDIDDKLETNVLGDFLGEKGSLSSSKHGDEVELHGMDLVGAVERIKHVAKEHAEVENTGSTGKGNYDEEFHRNHTEEEEEESIDNDNDNVPDRSDVMESAYLKRVELRTACRKVRQLLQEMYQQKESDEDEKVGMRNKRDVASLGFFGLITRMGFLNDENGILKHEFAPSRRSIIQVGSFVKENVSRPENDSKVLEEFQNLCLQNIVYKQRLSKSEHEVLHEEIKKLRIIDQVISIRP